MMPATSKAATGKRKLPPPLPLRPDWRWIERQYRTGRKTMREIARESTAKGRKVSHAAIAKRAKAGQWKQDLSDVIRARVGAELAADAVDAVDRDGATDAEIVEAAARQGVQVIRTHRNDINALQQVTNGLVAELVAGPEAVRDLVEVIEAGTTPAKDATKAQIESLQQRRERLMRMIGLQSRAGILKDLTQSKRHLIGLERQAFNLNDETAAPDSIEARLALLEEDD